jgi:16S rRNA (guanine966-N2)-methyltransferase
MRVIAGSYGGRPLKAPKGENTRPTSDRVREALFSILGTRTQDARVLDLFAGSGALGLEALSRGADTVTFVDDNRAAIAAIKSNLDTLQAVAQVRQTDALRFLNAAPSSGAQYDLVFLDPPYRHAERLAQPLSEALPAVLAPGAVVVAECDRRAPLALDLPLIDHRRYGDTLILIHGP